MSPAGGFSTTGPPEKPQDNVFLRGILKKKEKKTNKIQTFLHIPAFQEGKEEIKLARLQKGK